MIDLFKPPAPIRLHEEEAPSDQLVALVKHLSMMLNTDRPALHAYLCAKDSEIVGMLAWLSECAKLPEAQSILLVMKNSAREHGRRNDANLKIANIVTESLRKG
jgi:hypothetical protein